MTFLNNNIMQALSWTLIHSLWQGLLLALIAGAVIVYTKKSAVVLRYNLLAGVLMAFVLTGIGTFFYELNLVHQSTAGMTRAQGLTEEFTNDTSSFIMTTDTPTGNFLSSVISFLNSRSDIIVLIWLGIILLKCLQLVAGFRNMYLLRNRQTDNAGDYWVNRMQELVVMIGIKKPVQLLQSTLAKVPMVAGHLKPVILLPAGLLTSLPADEVEAILLHELAHIRRRDYLVNILQSFCEILYFFNPAVLWLSALVKDERENCCDDIAIAHMKNKKQFIHALIAFQEYNLAEQQVTLAFPGNRHHLLNRVKRILTNTNKTLNTMEKSILASGLLLSSLLFVAFAQHHTRPVEHKKATPAIKITPAVTLTAATVLQDTIPAKEKVKKYDFSINTTSGGKEYRIKVIDDKVTELYIDGEKIPDNKIADYKAATDKIIAETKEQAKKAREQAEVAKKKAEDSKAQMELAREEVQQSLKKLQEMQLKAEKDYSEAAKARSKAEESMYKADKERADQEGRLLESRELLKVYNEQMQLAKRQAERMRVDADRSYRLSQKSLFDQHQLALRTLERSKLMHEKALERTERAKLLSDQHLLRMQKAHARSDSAHQRIQLKMKSIVEDLTEAGVIKDKDADISFELTQSGLIVNGVKQSDELHQKLAKKYLKSSDDHIKYSRSGGSRHYDISIDDNDPS